MATRIDEPRGQSEVITVSPVPSPRFVDVLPSWPAVVYIAFGLSAMAMSMWIQSTAPLDYGEGPLLELARRILEGESLYNDFKVSPFLVDNYPPVFPALVAVLAKLTPLSLLACGRLLSSGAAVGSALLVASIVARSSSGSGAPSAALFLSHAFILEWATVARVDLLGLSFTLLAIRLLQRRPHSLGAAALAGGLLTLAIFTRQTFALAAPTACLCWLWYHRRRNALVLLSVLVVLNLGAYALLQGLTHGGFFSHVVRANCNEYSPARLAELGLHFVLFSAPLLTLVGITWLRARRRWNRALLVYAALALVGALTVGKVGSWHNYFIEPIAALCLMVGPRVVRRTTFARALFALQVAVGLVGTVLLTGGQARVVGLGTDDFRALKEAIRDARGPVLADDAMSLVVSSGHALVYQPFERLQLERAGLGRADDLREGLSARRYALIVLRSPGAPLCLERWGASLFHAIEQHYEPILRSGELVAYRPKA